MRLVRRLRTLVALNEPHSGGPYMGSAAESCVDAMGQAADRIEELEAIVTRMNNAMHRLATAMGHDEVLVTDPDAVVEEAVMMIVAHLRSGEASRGILQEFFSTVDDAIERGEVRMLFWTCDIEDEHHVRQHVEWDKATDGKMVPRCGICGRAGEPR